MKLLSEEQCFKNCNISLSYRTTCGYMDNINTFTVHLVLVVNHTMYVFSSHTSTLHPTLKHQKDNPYCNWTLAKSPIVEMKYRIPCGPSKMDYLETSGNLRKPAAVVSGRFPDFLFSIKNLKKIYTNKKFENLPETAAVHKLMLCSVSWLWDVGPPI